MAGSILVTYASRYGSTQEVAEAVAATLREVGLEVDVLSMGKVRTLDGYRAIVLGAPLYMGRLHTDANRFLERHREALIGRPVAIFALGPTRTGEKEWQEARAMVDRALASHPWLAPVALEMFGGKYDPAKLRFPDSLIAILPASPLHHAPASDARDWPAIRAWASGLAVRFPGTQNGR